MSNYGENHESFITACNNLVAHRSSRIGRRNAEKLQDAAEKVCARLKAPGAVSALERGFADLDDEMRKALYLELQYVNANLAEYENGSERDVDDAKTSKDSLAGLLDRWLTDWI